MSEHNRVEHQEIKQNSGFEIVFTQLQNALTFSLLDRFLKFLIFLRVLTLVFRFFVIVAMPVTMSLTIKLKEVEKLIHSKRSNFFAIGLILAFFCFSESSDFGVLIFCDCSNDSDYVID